MEVIGKLPEYDYDHKQQGRSGAELGRKKASGRYRSLHRFTPVSLAISELCFVYLNTEEYEDAKWRVMQVYDVPMMSRDRLVEIVRDKEVRARKYKKCDAYWLIVVVDFINPAQDQEIVFDNFDKTQTKERGQVCS